MTVTQWRAVIICRGKTFVGLIFVVGGTHENFNTTNISVYTVLMLVADPLPVVLFLLA